MNFRREVKMNLNKYFESPIFDRQKSTYTVRWQNQFEIRLMTYFDNEPRIKDYFQPLMSVVAKHNNREYLIDIDFWLEYADGEVNLVHIEREEFLWESQKQIMVKAKNWLQLDGFGFVVIGDGKLQRISSAQDLKFDCTSFAIDAIII